MNLAICSLASGSSGNCYLVRSEKTSILVDAGISARQILTKLGETGLSPDCLDGVLLTHEHSDHIQGLKTLNKKYNLRIYANLRTLQNAEVDSSAESTTVIETGSCFEIGDITVTSFPVSHDAGEPVGYFFVKDGCKISVVTDTGIVTEGARRAIDGADILVLESNHDENVLRLGHYPWFLKQRILGDKGHLSNEAASEALSQILLKEKEEGRFRRRTVLLAHLSKENNFPEMALITMKNILEQSGFVINREVIVEVLPRSESSKCYYI